MNRKRIFNIIQIGNKDDFWSKSFDYIIVFVILLNLLVTLLSTFDAMKKYSGLFSVIELVTIIFFTVEYILRLWTADYLYPNLSRPAAVFRFMFSVLGLIDLLTFVPYYLPIIFPAGIVAFRIFRVIRIFRLFRINAQYDAFNVIIDIISEKKRQILSSMVLIFIFLVAASLCMYDLEHEAQPELFDNAFSGMWWAVSALLTVGYGDIYPITTIGRILAILIAFLGVGMVAIPTGIISAGFVEHYTKMKSYKGLAHELQFIMADLDLKHPWCNKAVRDITFPPETTLVMIARNDEIILPTEDTILEDKDKLVLGGEDYKDEIGIEIDEIAIDNENPWIGKRVKDIEFNKNEMLLFIHRGDKNMVPNGSTMIREGDGVLLLVQDENSTAGVKKIKKN